MKHHNDIIQDHFDKMASLRLAWKKKNEYYHSQIERLYKFIIPPRKKVLEIGAGTGELLASVNPSLGVGIDISEGMVKIAQKKFPEYSFITAKAEDIPLNEEFEYVILSDLIGNLEDVQKAFEELHKISTQESRIIITYYNYLWEPAIAFAERFGLKMTQPVQNWLTQKDIENLLYLSNLDIIKKGTYLLFPFSIPLISQFLNKYLVRLPIIRSLALVQYFVVRQRPNLYSDKEYSISLVIPARNEEGNIERIVTEIPKLGKSTELVFVEGNSKDNTREKILQIIDKYKNKKNILFVDQKEGIGKADAVRKGIIKASGDIIIIFDADITVSCDQISKFYHCLRLKKGELIQGSRLVYPMEKQAMGFLNVLGNKFFSLAFTWLLDQPIKDTLCGTKALFRNDYEKIAKMRSYFGDFDPFGDFHLIFGASKLNLKIIEIPVRYKARTYGTTNISRFKHGLLLLKMTFFAARKIKFF